MPPMRCRESRIAPTAARPVSAAGAPVGSDDAAAAGVFALDALPPLVFDHATILADYVAYRASGRRPPPRR